jgi:hypothetical protein
MNNKPAGSVRLAWEGETLIVMVTEQGRSFSTDLVAFHPLGSGKERYA